MLKHIFIILSLLFFLGCTKEPQAHLYIDDLEEVLYFISNDTEEVKKLSYEMKNFSYQLKNDYKLVSPPLFHNFLVNTGLKDRGLCWHFAYDMLEHAKSLKLNSFDYYIGGANIDDYWEEHNSLVVTCKGCSFYKGIILDPWRNSGNLYYSLVKNDKEYKWTQRGEKR